MSVAQNGWYKNWRYSSKNYLSILGSFSCHSSLFNLITANVKTLNLSIYSSRVGRYKILLFSIINVMTVSGVEEFYRNTRKKKEVNSSISAPRLSLELPSILLLLLSPLPLS